MSARFHLGDPLKAGKECLSQSPEEGASSGVSMSVEPRSTHPAYHLCSSRHVAHVLADLTECLNCSRSICLLSCDVLLSAVLLHRQVISTA